MKKLLNCLLILLPVLLIFRHVFFDTLLTWGDAPFFYPEGLKELFYEPLTWVTRNISFGGVNSVLWISPIMFLMGVLNKVLILGSDATVKILFYFPSIIFCIVGPYFLCRYLKVSKTVSFFSTLTYPLSTYYLLLVDGGQIGVVLAYGLFPLIILFGKRMFDKTTVLTFFLFLLSSFILTVADPRIVFIAYLTLFIWQLFEDWKKLLFLIISGILLISLNFYWIFTLIKIKTEALGLGVSDLQLSSLLNSLLLYAPHWPNNIFGKVVQPPFYFCLIPFLVFGSLLFKREKRILTFAFLFLIFSFLAKGTTFPFGGFYNFLVNLPFEKIYEKTSLKGIAPSTPPLGLACIAGSLTEKKHQVKIFDFNLYDEKKFSKLLEEFNPDYVGISFVTPLINEANRVAKIVKNFNEKIILVGGGPHCSSFPEKVLEETILDIVVIGEGDFVIQELVEGKKLNFIKGVGYRVKNEIKINKRADIIKDLDELPFPAHFLYEIQKYKVPSAIAKNNPVAWLETSRGCVYGCIYCNKSCFGRTFRVKSPERVAQEFSKIEKMGFKEVHLTDDGFTTDMTRAKKICDLLIEKKNIVTENFEGY